MTDFRARAARLRTPAIVLTLLIGGLSTTAVANAADDPSTPGATPSSSTSTAPSDETGTGTQPAGTPSFTLGAPEFDKSNDPNKNGKVDPGEVVVYRFAVTNTSPASAPALQLGVSFARPGSPAGYCDSNSSPAPGSTATCYVQTVATAADLAAGAVQPAQVTVTSPGATTRTTTTPANPPVVRDCSYNAPDSYSPGDTSWFNYPYGSTAGKNAIRTMVLRTINSTPQCESIRIAAYSLNDNETVDALIRAAHRGVSVHVITDGHNIRGDKATQSPSFKRLMGVLGSSTAQDSWAKVCSGSCRGTGGNHHDKLYLFSRAGGRSDITMAGSANLTIKAATGQWNHLDTYTSGATWEYYNFIFNQLAADRALPQPYSEATTDAVRTWFFPRPGTTAKSDPLMRELSQVRCTGSAYNGGRTMIRIGMYAWYETRGLWLAQRVRALWNAGCNVAVEYAIMGNNVKRTLYSPAGRGRIPMRQVATYYRDGSVANYDHQKYVTLLGNYGGNRAAAMTWTGTTNFSNFGLSSDELTQVWAGSGLGTRAAMYRKAFYNVWRGPHTRVPSPTSALRGKVTLGAGKYRGFETN